MQVLLKLELEGPDRIWRNYLTRKAVPRGADMISQKLSLVTAGTCCPENQIPKARRSSPPQI